MRHVTFAGPLEKARWLDAGASLDATTREARTVARQLADGRGDEDAVRAICRHIRDGVAYVPDVVDGVPYERLESAQTVLERRADDCDGKARTFVAIVRALDRPGVEARIRPLFVGESFEHVQAEARWPGSERSPRAEPGGWRLVELIVDGVGIDDHPFSGRRDGAGRLRMAGPAEYARGMSRNPVYALSKNAGDVDDDEGGGLQGGIDAIASAAAAAVGEAAPGPSAPATDIIGNVVDAAKSVAAETGMSDPTPAAEPLPEPDYSTTLPAPAPEPEPSDPGTAMATVLDDVAAAAKKATDDAPPPAPLPALVISAPTLPSVPQSPPYVAPKLPEQPGSGQGGTPATVGAGLGGALLLGAVALIMFSGKK